MKIYVDLDGVLADFSGYLLTQGLDVEEATPKEMWKKVNSIPDFYLNLPWDKYGKILWSFVKPYNPTILTGLATSTENSTEHKKAWCARELGPEVPVIVCLKKEKKNYASPDSILIDDNRQNIKEWIVAGGIGICHYGLREGTKETVSELKRLLGATKK